MVPRVFTRGVTAAVLIAISHACLAVAPGTLAFQGVLQSRTGEPITSPASGTPVTFSLYTAATGGTAVWTENQTVFATKGHFTASLGSVTPFAASGLVFDKPYWIGVKVAGDAAEMAPRLPLQSVPYALGAWSLGGNAGTGAASFLGTSDARPLILKANGQRGLYLEDRQNAGGVRSVNVLAGSPLNSIAAGVVGATIAGGGSATGGTLAINDLRGDFGVIGGGSNNFVDAAAHIVIAGGSGNIGQGAFSVIGGGAQNNTQGDYSTITGGQSNYTSGKQAAIGGGLENQAVAALAVVAGGSGNVVSGASSFIGAGTTNSISQEHSAILGGSSNVISGGFSIVGGGDHNQITGWGSTIGGGTFNSAPGGASTVGGGSANTAGAASAFDATVAGGQGNKATGEDSAVGGGWLNTASERQSVVAGGTENVASGPLSTVGGGWKNNATGYESTVPGGYSNYATATASFAAGYRAAALHAGAFVWSDASSDTYCYSSAPNQFSVRAFGGIVLESGQSVPLYTASTSGEKGRYLQILNSPQTPSASGLKAGGILCADSYDFSTPGKNQLIVKGGAAFGAPNNGDYTIYAAGKVGGTQNWNASSDARLKTNVAPVADALASVLSLRGVTFDWRRAEYPGMRLPDGRHYGFIAQEIEKVLPEVVTTDPFGYKAVSYGDVVPVLVEAVKTLKQQNDDLAARNKALEDRLDAMDRRLMQVEAKGRQVAPSASR